jgi:hypothetical protein
MHSSSHFEYHGIADEEDDDDDVVLASDADDGVSCVIKINNNSSLCF